VAARGRRPRNGGLPNRHSNKKTKVPCFFEHYFHRREVDTATAPAYAHGLPTPSSWVEVYMDDYFCTTFSAE
jgi:hypothetical protein